jgi:hypothetical protein
MSVALIQGRALAGRDANWKGRSSVGRGTPAVEAAREKLQTRLKILALVAPNGL